MTHTVVSAIGIMKRTFEKLRAYEFNFFITLIGLPLIIISNIVLWEVIFAHGSVPVFTYSQMITYQIFAFILVTFIFNRKTAEGIDNDVIRGDIVTYQVRPIHYMFYRFFADFTSFLIYGVYAIFLFVISSFFIEFELTSSLLFLGLGALSCFLAFCLSFVLIYCLGSIALWWEHSKGLFLIYTTFMEFLAGAWIPLDIFPQALQTIIGYLPFKSIIYFPVRTFMGFLTLEEILKGIGMQLIWIAIFLALALFIWKRGIKQFTGYGV